MLPPRHAGAGQNAGMPLTSILPLLHRGAEIGAGIAVDDDRALGQPRADLVAARVGADESELGDVVALDLEDVADGHCLARRADGERFDLLRLEAGERAQASAATRSSR